MEWFWDQFKRGQRAGEAVATYRRLEHVAVLSPTNQAYTKNLDKSQDADGDTLTIMSLQGGLPLYVRLGQDGNPFMRVRERAIYTRPFRRVTWRVGNTYDETANASRGYAKVIAMVSHGPLVQFPPKEYGIRRMPLMIYGLTATTANTDLSSLLRKASGVGNSTLGKGGGTLMIYNTDAANDLYVVPIGSFAGVLAAGTRGFGPIRPGASLPLQLEDCIFSDAAQLDAGGLVIKTLSGTCTYALIGSSVEMDGADNEQDVENTQGLK